MTVNFYAAAKAATGVTEDTFSPGSLAKVISAASLKYPKLVSILPGCSYLINGLSTVRLDVEVESGDVVDVLPRFAGGA